MRTAAGPHNLRRGLARGFLAALTMLASLTLLTATPAHATTGTDEQSFFTSTNAIRQQNGLGTLQWDEALANVARSWSPVMAGAGTLSHNGNLANMVTGGVTSAWT